MLIKNYNTINKRHKRSAISPAKFLKRKERMVFGFGGNNGDHHHRSSYGATPSTLEGDQQQRLIGKEEEDGDLKLSVVKRTRAFFSGRKSNHILGAIGTGLAVVGCASAYSSSFSPSSSPFFVVVVAFFFFFFFFCFVSSFAERGGVGIVVLPGTSDGR